MLCPGVVLLSSSCPSFGAQPKRGSAGCPVAACPSFVLLVCSCRFPSLLLLPFVVLLMVLLLSCCCGAVYVAAFRCRGWGCGRPPQQQQLLPTKLFGVGILVWQSRHWTGQRLYRKTKFCRPEVSKIVSWPHRLCRTIPRPPYPSREATAERPCPGAEWAWASPTCRSDQGTRATARGGSKRGRSEPG